MRSFGLPRAASTAAPAVDRPPAESSLAPCPALRVRGVMGELAGPGVSVGVWWRPRAAAAGGASARSARAVIAGSRPAGVAAARIRRAASTDSSSQAAVSQRVSGQAPGPGHIRAGCPGGRAATARTGLSAVTSSGQIPLLRSKVPQALSAGQPGRRRGAGVRARRGSGRRPSGLRFPRGGCRSSRRPGRFVRQSCG